MLNQLIEALLNPNEDVQRYIYVLEHHCWLADELGESEIICPIVEFATQLIPQLQRLLRNSKISMRKELLHDSGSHSGSDSEDIQANNVLSWVAPNVNEATSPGKSKNDPLVQRESSSKLNFSSVIKGLSAELDRHPTLGEVLVTKAAASVVKNSELHSRSESKDVEFELDQLQDAALHPQVAFVDDGADYKVSRHPLLA